MSMKRSSDEAEAPHTAIIPWPAKKTRKGTNIILHDDARLHIVSFVGAKTLAILTCAGKTTRDAAVFRDDFMKAEEMNRQALDGYERSLGKQHTDTKNCAKNLAILLAQTLRDKEKTRELIKTSRMFCKYNP
eukprot:CAMPEP_0182453710 /NCGR_PEP_ID=MMETSP1319-20130603/660_1 /TAXON_ID=172717 /ORGANISM="Bolidomonas pacifica, Strain RCC208" /LENGTH=131 /DNA_ID=CAMNT_0024651663 /DNA_START=152 /DNA_END=548 /DNA_ORIENTATION=+